MVEETRSYTHTLITWSGGCWSGETLKNMTRVQWEKVFGCQRCRPREGATVRRQGQHSIELIRVGDR